MATSRLYIEPIETNNTEQDEMNVQATANALFEMHEEMKTVKRNKRGSINGNSRHVRYLACKEKLVAAGWTSLEASDLTWKVLGSIK